MNKTKVLKYGIIATVAVIILVFVGIKAARARKYKKMENEGSGTINDGSQNKTNFPLKKGKKGKKVKTLQTALNRYAADESHLNKIKVDGVFGPKTEDLLTKLFGEKTVSKSLYDLYFKRYEIASTDWFTDIIKMY